MACYNPTNRHERVESERFRVFSYDDLLKREQASLDISWLRDESLEDSANLPDPDVIAAEIAEDLRAALEQFEQAALGALTIVAIGLVPVLLLHRAVAGGRAGSGG